MYDGKIAIIIRGGRVVAVYCNGEELTDAFVVDFDTGANPEAEIQGEGADVYPADIIEDTEGWIEQAESYSLDS